MSTSAPSASLTGRVLGDFVIESEIAAGGQGDVYLAKQPALAREAVVKILRVSDEVATQRFLREARLASQLDHPYAAHIYAFGAEPDGVLWIAMELVRGTSLKAWIDHNGPFKLARFVPLLERICEVLADAHERGIVHRDLKPENIMVMSRAGRLMPKLLDFGIAKALVDGIKADDSDDAEWRLAEGQAATLQTLADAVTSGVSSTTEKGAILGSPHYMAPEQWFSPSQVDARADLYSLGAVAYEALSGESAFRGDSVMQLARAHAKSPPPSLPKELPVALSAVIAKALGKRPDDRYESMIDFSRAFRDASDRRATEVVLPPFDATIRDAVLTSAPQPIAECLSAYEGARDLDGGLQALFGLAESCLELVAVIALCGRHHSGGFPAADDEPELCQLIRRWCDQGLTGTEKLELATALVAPFVDSPDLFPVPELVISLVTKGEILGDLAKVSSGRTENPRAACERAVTALEHALEKLSFLSDYPLVVRVRDQIVLLAGVRRRRPSIVNVDDLELFAEGEPTLIDSSGYPMVNLYPVAQTASPSPGEAEELFILNRGHHLGVVMVARPVGFEHRDDQVLPFLSPLLGKDSRVERAFGDDKAPYRGLSTFSASDADWYFGREAEVEAFANRLRTQHFVAVVGPSGVGKSSFIRAGVLPQLGDVAQILLRPGRTPLESLCAAASEVVGAELTPADVAERLGQFARDSKQMVIIIVDQFEELVTLCRSREERERFGQILVDLGFGDDSEVRVIVTLRDDFLMRLEQVSSLRNYLGRGIQLLSTPAADDLRRTLTEPARKVGYSFEPESLPDLMVEAVEARPGALALLSFTALKLWQLRDERFKKLKESAYEKMGAVGGALAQHAEETLSALTEGQRELVREAFRHLVTADGTRAVMAKGELLEVLGASEDAEHVLESLITARLLTASDDSDDMIRVEVVHEALLSAWPRLVEWRQAEAESARLRDQLRDAARQWDDRGRPKGLLWRDDALIEYTLWRPRYRGKLTRRERDFAEASVADANAGRRRRRALLIGAVATLTVASAILLFMYRDAQRQRRVAVAAESAAEASAEAANDRLVELLVEQGRLAALDQQPLKALAYLEAATSSGGGGSALDYLATTNLRKARLQRASYSGHKRRVTALAASADRARFVSASWTDDDATAVVWEAKSGRQLLRFTNHERGISELELSTSGVVLTVDRGQTALVWRSESGEVLHRATGAARGEFRADGNKVAIAGKVGVEVIDLETGERRLWSSKSATMAVWDERALVVLFADASISRLTAGGPRWTVSAADLPITTQRVRVVGGHVVGYAEGRKTPFVVRSDTGGELRSLEGFSGDVADVEVNRESKQIAIAIGNQVGVWSSSGSLKRLLDGGASIETIAFSAGGDQLAAGTDNGSVLLFDVPSGARKSNLHGHTGAIWSVSFLSDDDLLSGAVDHTVKRWSTQPSNGQQLASDIDGLFRDPGGTVYALRGRQIVQVEKQADQWRLAPLAELAANLEPFGFFGLLRGTVSTDRILALPTKNGPIAVAIDTGELVGRCLDTPTPDATSAAISADGRFLVGTRRAGTPILCDLKKNESIPFRGEPIGGLGSTFDRAGDRLLISGVEAAVWRTNGERLPGPEVETKTVFWFAEFDGDELITASIDGVIRKWRGHELAREYRGGGFLTSAAMTGDVVVGFDNRGSIYIWDGETAKLVGTIGGGARGDIVVSFDDAHVLARYRNSELVVYELGIDPGAARSLSREIECELPYRVEDGVLTLTSAEQNRCD